MQIVVDLMWSSIHCSREARQYSEFSFRWRASALLTAEHTLRWFLSRPHKNELGCVFVRFLPTKSELIRFFSSTRVPEAV